MNVKGGRNLKMCSTSTACWWRLINAALLAILFFHGFSLAENAPNFSFMRQATTAPRVSYYDYIIVGGGTSGCALAATLSEKYNVLLLERGGSPYGNPNITRVEPWVELMTDGSPGSPSQPFVSEDGVNSVRPRVLGGGTSINAGFYSRAQASYVREAGWDGKLVNESFRWVENKVVFQPLVRGWQSALRAGMVEAGVTPYNGFTYDHLTGTKVGGTIVDAQGNRHTSADLLEYANPKRITVLLRAIVHRIIFSTKGKSRPVASGVIFRDALGRKHIAHLKDGFRNEIILSAGALGSPQLLMLSGLGPKEHLEAHKIKVVLDQPLVGQRMKDNPMNNVFVPSPIPVDIDAIILAAITPSGNYIEGGSGLNLGFATPTAYGNYSFRRGGFILTKFIGPQSFGHLELRNRNPSDNPAVTFNYFKDPVDLERCVHGMETILRIVESKAFSKYKVASLSGQDILNITTRLPQNMPVNANTSSSLEQFCKDTVKTIWHYHGGCQVGRVVDHDYKVNGVDGLRVIDGSTFDSSPGTNPQATVMMLGRYMGVRMLRERNIK